MAKEIEKAIAAVLFQMAEQSVKNGQYEKGAQAYLALVKRYPLVSFSDKAVFEAGAAYENAKQYTKAAETFMILPKQYSSSPLTIKGVLRAASAYKKDNKPREAATTFLFITNQFPQPTTSTPVTPWVSPTAVWASGTKPKTASAILRNSRFPTSPNATCRMPLR